MSGTKDIKKDGGSMVRVNGFFHRNSEGITYVRIPWVVLALVITVLIALIPAVMAYGVLNEKVVSMELEFDDSRDQYFNNMANIELRLDDLDQTASGTEVALQNIHEDLQEIKAELILLRRDLNPEGGS